MNFYHGAALTVVLMFFTFLSYLFQMYYVHEYSWSIFSKLKPVQHFSFGKPASVWLNVILV